MGRLLDRLAAGPVICAEGYLFEFERRGYLQAGAFVPEVVLEEPDMVAGLHREYVHAGSDVVEAFTYYAHREKLAVIGREGDLERMNRQALRIAKEVGAEHDSLVAGNICNTNVYDPDDPATHQVVRDMFAEQVGWAAEAGVDFVIAETIDQVVEAAEGAFKRLGEPLAVTGSQQVKHQAGERRLYQRRLAFGVLGPDAVSDQAVGDVLAPKRDLLRTHITGQTADRGVQRGGFETQSHQRQVLRAAVDPPPPAPLQLRRGDARYLPPPRPFDSSLNLSGPPQCGDHQFVLAAEVMHQRVDRHTQCAGNWPQ